MRKKYDEALSIARQQVEDGAQIIDINMDDGLLDAEKEMTTFLNLMSIRARDSPCSCNDRFF